MPKDSSSDDTDLLEKSSSLLENIVAPAEWLFEEVNTGIKARILGEAYEFGCAPIAEVNAVKRLEHGGIYPKSSLDLNFDSIRNDIEQVKNEETEVRKSSNSTRKHYPQLSIIGIMQHRRLDETSRVMSFLIVSLFLSVVLSTFKVIEWGTVQFASAIPIILLAIRWRVLNYRVGQGLYGNNEKEARDIIEFIVKESTNIDFTDGGKPKKILSDEDLEEINQTVTRPVPGFAGAGGENE